VKKNEGVLVHLLSHRTKNRVSVNQSKSDKISVALSLYVLLVWSLCRGLTN
jgi:hypothetical protein